MVYMRFRRRAAIMGIMRGVADPTFNSFSIYRRGGSFSVRYVIQFNYVVMHVSRLNVSNRTSAFFRYISGLIR